MMVAAIASMATYFLLKFDVIQMEHDDDKPTDSVRSKSIVEVIMVEEVSSTDSTYPATRKMLSAKIWANKESFEIAR